MLELKHLAPYLPYGLTIKNIMDGSILEMSIESELYPYKRKTDLNGIISAMVVLNSNTVKPILRPMSDLNKMIQHPTEKAHKANLYSSYDLEVDEEGDFCDRYYADQCESPSILLPIASFNWWLFEWHFDVFDLIPAGLAIDINTINHD